MALTAKINPELEGRSALPCPSCGHHVCGVTDSRHIDGCIRRRRKCGSCDYRFTTYETVGATQTVRLATVLRALERAEDLVQVLKVMRAELDPASPPPLRFPKREPFNG